MGIGLFSKGFVTYKGRSLWGKVAALFLLGWCLPAAADPIRIVAFGDSLTQGYGLPIEDGFVPQLQAWLGDQVGVDGSNVGDFTLINAGVSGDTTAGGRARVAWTLSEKFDAMIVTLGGNDLLRGIDPANSRANIRYILEQAQLANVDVLLVGMHAPANYGPSYQVAFDALYPALSQEFGTLYVSGFFDGLGDGSPAGLLAFMQKDGIHPNAEGVRRIVETLGPRVLELIERAAAE